jgi:MFS family permease
MSQPNPVNSEAEAVAVAEGRAPIRDVAGARQSRWFIPTFLISYFALNLAVLTSAGITIPLRIASLDPSGKASVLALTAGIGGVVVLIATPLFGRLSDRSMSRRGIRRPFIFWGAIAGSVGLMVIALAPSVPLLIVGWCIAQAGFAATNSAVHALLADQIPTRIRARVAAAWGLAASLAPVIGGFLIGALPANPVLWFGVPVVIAIALNLTLVVVLRDIVRTERPEPLDLRTILSSYWLSPRKHPDFAWAWFCRLFVTMSIVSVSTFMLFFVTDELGVPASKAATTVGSVLGIYFVAGIVTTILFAWISDRTGRRKVIVCVSSLLTAVGLLIAVTSHDTTTFLIGIAVAGMGQGAYISVDVALMTEVLPSRKNAGKDLGVVALAYLLPQLIVPLISVPILAIGGGASNYRALFAAAVVMAILGGLAVLPIKKVR